MIGASCEHPEMELVQLREARDDDTFVFRFKGRCPACGHEAPLGIEYGDEPGSFIILAERFWS